MWGSSMIQGLALLPEQKLILGRVCSYRRLCLGFTAQNKAVVSYLPLQHIVTDG